MIVDDPLTLLKSKSKSKYVCAKVLRRYVDHCQGCVQAVRYIGISEKPTPLRIPGQFNAHKTDDVIIIIPSNYVTVIAFQNTFFSICCYTTPSKYANCMLLYST